MAFNTQADFTKKPADLPDVPSPTYTPSDIKSYFETPSDETKTYIKTEIVDKLNSTTSGNSGADNIGATGFDGSASNPQAMLNDLNTRKADKNGDWTGTWQGFTPSQVDQTIRDQVNTNTAQLEDITNVLNSAVSYGFVADYSGTPQYDGLDGTRITCTDNTQAFAKMLDDCIAKKNLKVYFPPGHFGIKTGMIQKDLTGCNLTLYGIGIDSTMIDFVKEDNTHSAYVDETMANYIARITNANIVTIKDLTLKATTNYNNVNGNQTDNNAVYYGAVWGLIFDTFTTLRLDNVKISKFNYRGILTLTSGQTLMTNFSKEVIVNKCLFTENKGSGLWLKQVQKLTVTGGEYSYNGQRGTVGTGYGITASENVGKCTVENAHFHHNYRKGFDTHGCLRVELLNNRFEDNVLSHLALMDWGHANDTGEIVLDNNIFSNGLNQDSINWLKDCYSAITGFSAVETIRGLIMNINDDTGTCVLKSVKLINNIVLSHYNGGDTAANNNGIPITIKALNGIITLKGNEIDFAGMVINSNVIESACFFSLGFSELYINAANKIKLIDGNYATGKFGALINMSTCSGSQKISMKDNVLDLVNNFILCSSSSGNIGDPPFNTSSLTTFEGNEISWDTFPATTTQDKKLFGAVFNSTYVCRLKNNSVRIGNIYYLIPSTAKTEDYKTFAITATFSYTAGSDYLSIVVDNTTNFVAEINIHPFDDRLIIRVDAIGTNTIIQDGTISTLSSTSTFVDTDGRTKVKIVLKAKSYSLQSGIYGDVRIKGQKFSWGIESVNKL